MTADKFPRLPSLSPECLGFVGGRKPRLGCHEGDAMLGFEPAGWQMMRGNFAVFAIVCAITNMFGGMDPALVLIG